MDTKKKSRRWLSMVMFAITATFFFYEFALQVSPGVMAHSLMKTFAINATTMGLVSGTYYFSYTGMQIPMGLLYGRFGARRMITVAAAICALGSILFGLAPTISAIAAARFLMGLGSAFAFVGVLFIALRWFPIQYFAIFAGITQTLGSIGAMTGQGPFATAINHIGWRETMIILGIIGFGISICTWLFLRDRPKGFEEIEAQERIGVWKALKSVLRIKQTWPIGLYSFAIWAPIAAFGSLWGVPYLSHAYHISNVFAGDAIAMIWLGTAIGSPLAGWFSNVVQRRCSVLAGLAALGFISIMIAVYVNHLPLSILFIALFFMGFAAGGQSLAFAVVKDNHRTNTSSAAMGVNNMCVVFGGALFQPLIGKLLDLHHKGPHLATPQYSTGDYHFALLLLPVCFLVSTVVAILWMKETRCKNKLESAA
jgi:MFS family permease